MSDALSNVLSGVRPQGALFDHSVLRSPWAWRVEEGAPLTLLTMLSGDAWITLADGDATPISSRDAAIVIGPAPYTIGERADIAPQVVLTADGRCHAPGGERLDDAPDLCRHDSGADAPTLLKATFGVHDSVCDRLLAGAPPVVVLPAASVPGSAIDMVVAELSADRAGRQAVLDRLLELLLVSVLREWLDRPASSAPSWYRAQADPVVGTALRLMHDDPAHPWTVAELASRTAVSRAAFARRFTELAREPPMSYLACWRTCLAADLLVESDATIGAIARQVGYANAYALSVAFKRIRGIRPSDHRALAGATGDATPHEPVLQEQ